jgi:hypothetical protein
LQTGAMGRYDSLLVRHRTAPAQAGDFRLQSIFLLVG